MLSSNFKTVKVRTDRGCKICGSMIKKGSTCLTINPRNSKRFWVHSSCYKNKVEKLQEIKEAEENLAFVSFDDEGAAQYYTDQLNIAVTSFEQEFGECY